MNRGKNDKVAEALNELELGKDSDFRARADIMDARNKRAIVIAGLLGQ